MKIIKYVDVTLQSMLLTCAIYVVLSRLPGFDPGAILGIQLLMGIYQMSSCLLSVIFGTSRVRRKKLFHLGVSTLYLLSLWLISYWNLNENFVRSYLIIPSWTLAIYYYVLSFNGLRNLEKRSKFLPNLGF